MHHGVVSRPIARGLSILRERLSAAKIPSSKNDETLLVAPWNVRELGKHPRLDASLYYLAEAACSTSCASSRCATTSTTSRPSLNLAARRPRRPRGGCEPSFSEAGRFRHVAGRPELL